MTTLGDRIKSIRKDSGYNQEQFAEKIGGTQSSVATWESGKRVPSGAVIKSISKTFGVDEYWLRTGEGDPEPLNMTADDASRIAGEMLKDADPWYRDTMMELIRTTPEHLLAAWAKEIIRWAKELEKGPPKE